jgi:hypothetical protein
VLVEHEWVQEDLGYREFLIPASLLNTFGPPTVVEAVEDDVDEDLRVRVAWARAYWDRRNSTKAGDTLCETKTTR